MIAMYTGQIAQISNKATWLSDVIELVDEDDGTTTDLSDPELDVDIVVTIRRLLRDGCCEETVLVTGSVDDEKVTIIGPGFRWMFEDTDLTNLCAGTYQLGVKVTINGFIQDLIIGTVVVIEGN